MLTQRFYFTSQVSLNFIDQTFCDPRQSRLGLSSNGRNRRDDNGADRRHNRRFCLHSKSHILQLAQASFERVSSFG
jgi:hypothetical protein